MICYKVSGVQVRKHFIKHILVVYKETLYDTYSLCLCLLIKQILKLFCISYYHTAATRHTRNIKGITSYLNPKMKRKCQKLGRLHEKRRKLSC